MSKINSSQVNHVYFLVDSSGSMQPHSSKVKEFCNSMIKEISTNIPNVENRVSIYTFNGRCRRDLTDGDPQFAGFDNYFASGGTALGDALGLVIDDISAVRSRADQRNRTFLVYVVTDGEDNESRTPANVIASKLSATLQQVVTLAAFIPTNSPHGEKYVRSIGVPHGNIQVWDAARGDFEHVKSVTTQSLRDYGTLRASGATSSNNLFRPNVAEVQKAVNAGQVAEFTGKVLEFDVKKEEEIAPFVIDRLNTYVKGTAYYQLTKAEKLGPSKNVLIRHRVSGKVYHGPNARSILGIPNGSAKISVDRSSNPVWDVFVQSTSLNRKLVPNTKLLILP